MNKDLSIEQICTHYGEDKYKNRGAVVTPIYQTSIYSLNSEYMYTRGKTPNFEVVEQKVAAMDGADYAVLFSSGVAVMSAVFTSLLASGDHVVMVRNAYPGARELIEDMQKFGVEHTYVSGKSVDEFIAAVRPNTKLIYLESPSSIMFELQPVAEICAFARSKGIYTAIDNTCATSLFQKPIALGVDIVVYSASKYLGGHSDVVAGIAVTDNEELAEKLRNNRVVYGGNSAPLNAWLIERGIRTLPARMNVVSKNGMAVAKYLESHKHVAYVNHPPLESYSQHDLYKKQMTGSGGLFSFKPKTEDLSKYNDFISRCRVFCYAISWGGYESLVNCIDEAITDDMISGKKTVDPVIRLYTGLEDTASLLEDIEQALKAFD